MYFSVVVPLYNKRNHIARTLYSILEQTHTRFEVIVVDDGSDDGSEEVVKNITDARISLINQANQGPSVARNLGVEKAQFDFVCLLDADDVWLPDFLERISTLIESFPANHIFCLRHIIIDTDGHVLLPKVDLPDDHRGVVSNFIKLYKRSTGLVNASSVCFRKSYFLSLGGFPENEDLGEDTFLWLLYALESDIVFSNQVGSKYFRNSDNRSTDRVAPNKLPYYFNYFFPLLKEPEFAQRYSAEKSAELKAFLRWRTVLHISDIKQSVGWKVAYQHSMKLIQLDFISGFVGVLITLIPPCIIKGCKFLRGKRRAAVA